MVTNYSILHDIPKLKIQKKKLLHAAKELDRILKGEKRPYRSNRFIRRITPKIHEEYEKKRTTSPFNVNDSCISCGICVKNCPVNAMEMGEIKPSWVMPKCDNCLHCLHHCPVDAINYGDSTQNRLRYTYESCFKEST
ncbi:EFR1 family ferrodoxin [Sedimentibacter sp.]|uniref:EFR1 family ferrodoxin n=1 Tax=Sedimentibacter sp. TaxID=1960295 RepID=UPI0028965FCD|nr:EFR1 family ferrodoxin [Sedimentibacter sp.]